jgi:hypothetical protein
MVRDAQGAPVVPASIAYTIFAVQPDGSKSLVSSPRLPPAPGERGAYYVTMTIPSSWAEGNYQLVWYLQQTLDVPEVQVVEDFAVIQLRPGSGSMEAPSVLMAKRLQTTEFVVEMVMTVRELLSDTNPDRNYHFRPPTAAKQVAGYTTRVGFIWTDQTILRLLKLAIATINTANPKNLYSYTLDNLTDTNWQQAASLGAAAHCLSAESARWMADEFGYSLNGVSLDLEKSGKYQGLAQQYMAEFTQWLQPLTANRPKSVGLRQMKFLR